MQQSTVMVHKPTLFDGIITAKTTNGDGAHHFHKPPILVFFCGDRDILNISSVASYDANCGSCTRQKRSNLQWMLQFCPLLLCAKHLVNFKVMFSTFDSATPFVDEYYKIAAHFMGNPAECFHHDGIYVQFQYHILNMFHNFDTFSAIMNKK